MFPAPAGDRGLHVLQVPLQGPAALKALPLKALTRMNNETHYPQDGEAPVDRFDTHDSDQALSLAHAVLSFVSVVLEVGRGSEQRTLNTDGIPGAQPRLRRRDDTRGS
ncbi:MAG: hypothetical protein RLZZ611_2316 [Cyanobacteriota bacterium]|jgi:hypothetical protein